MRKIEILEKSSWCRVLTTSSEVERYFSEVKENSLLTFDWETTGLDYDATPLLLSLHFHEDMHPAIVPVDFYFKDGISMGELARLLNKWFPKFRLVAHNAKYDMMISKVNGVSDEALKIYADTLVMIHLYNPDLEKKLETRVHLDFEVNKKTFEEWITPEDSKRKRKWTDINWDEEADTLEDVLAGYSAEDTWWETKMYKKYSPLLTTEERNIHDKIEVPLINILCDAKIRGVLINKELLLEMDEKAKEEEKRLLQKVYDHCGCVFNLNSPKQKKEIFFDKLKYPVITTTSKGQPSTDAKTFQEWANRGLQVGTDLNEYSKIHKLITGYLDTIPKLLDDENVLRGDLNSCGTKTGRCIEEHQRVMTVGGLKQIRDMKVGDLVYCYDNEGKLHIRKVLNVFRQGIKKLVRVKYQSTGDMKEGYLLCTPDHLLKTKKRGWVQAKDLHREKVYHLRSSNKYQEFGHTRPRLYGTNGVTNYLILSVKPYGEGECYDIEVEDYKNFICEELCVHNCSSSGPNLQNQPNNPDFPVRKAFVPRPGYVFVNYDYSQLELRMLAHLSGDKNYTQVFLNNEDPHGDVAKRLGITRKKAKTVNFGISYGMTKKGLAASLKISEEEAESIIYNYYKTYDGYAKWEKIIQQKACKLGYTENIFGRRRYFSELTKDPFHRDKAMYFGQLRDVVNTTVQGSGADVMKRATVATVLKLKEENIDAHFLLQVHDENLFEAKIGYDAMRCEQIMIECMQETTTLRVPLLADGKIIANWAEMHDEDLPSLPFRIDTSILVSLL